MNPWIPLVHRLIKLLTLKLVTPLKRKVAFAACNANLNLQAAKHMQATTYLLLKANPHVSSSIGRFVMSWRRMMINTGWRWCECMLTEAFCCALNNSQTLHTIAALLSGFV
jgi:hypothetical protein